ncbi:hypothetical protein AVEN_90917-1 [Araneus ventricosus]|uniref:Uncharacterized protein n=1 Tax=Araneus ventricosus TaxID=182803 RepID=A0A4Y1ZKX6_ARAVE|nr:hypothetical protein AVEN_90917-1 [Araneus ventricosus]
MGASLIPLMYSPQLYGSDSRSNSGVIIGSSQNWCRWKCFEETGLFGILSPRHFHRHQFCEDPIITPRVRATDCPIYSCGLYMSAIKDGPIILYHGEIWREKIKSA